jgi:hypothetical protein
MTVGLALRANPQAPFERTSGSYHQNIATGEKTEPARKMPRLLNPLEIQSPLSGEAERGTFRVLKRTLPITAEIWSTIPLR